ncbi:MAG: FG-GAP repeat domain-containing protein [Verrucomicrobiales bacterium]
MNGQGEFAGDRAAGLSSLAVAGILLSLLAVAACSRKTNQSAKSEDAALAKLTASEELILMLTPATRKLGQGASALKLPNEETAVLFGESVAANSLAGPIPDETMTFSIPGVSRLTWMPSPEQRPIPRSELSLWREIFSTVDGITESKFFPIKGAFLSGERNRFLCTTGLEALARQKGGWRQIKAEMNLTWQQKAGDSAAWEIAEWKTTQFTVFDAPKRFFSEALDEALPRPEDLMRARHSQHERNLIDYFTKDSFNITTENKLAGKYIDLDSTFQHPSISVADVDGDGWDDLYLTQRWGRNMLLRNNCNGTFTDVAGSVGLDIKDFCNASLFADFDNDGDQDVFVGRSLEPSLYLVNEGGRFVDRSRDMVAVPLPRLVSSLAAADYDGDGWLDIYLGTYGPTAAERPVREWGPDLLSPDIIPEMEKRSAESHRYLNLLGPPNLLLRNSGGGRFVVSPHHAQVADWHNTNQPAWSDYDDDGDPDLYVSNDFGPSTLYRNDGPKGFLDMTAQAAGTAMQGFGMGASWADYDGDARLDLYVSNMFSKAGRRITAQIPGLDPRTPYSADGSLLFRNVGTGFEQVAGTEAPALFVAKVGWAYGGQFSDFDNDTWPDLFVASGFYTAPDEIAEDEDL